ncbi:cytochrome P450 family protein [Streptomyces sp. GS7]|uniref:cytochrome P450 family protein n=1 Tax=Streptomyces sp. GS7 TaxID=2692234 RepID=UPI0013161080|nr:cytochrome P450 [Streptomyces sp. GS7]QHC20460.1 cytochrome P450 [Streptomyces sp. GS7]
MTDVEYDLSDPAFITDPAAAERWLSAPRPACPGRSLDGSPVLVVTRYETAREVLSDPRFTSRPPGDSHIRGLLGQGVPEDLAPLMSSTLLSMDTADHNRVRPLVTLAFSAKRVRSLRPRIEELVTGLLDAMDPGVEVDLLGGLADPLPLAVIGELLGVDAADRAQWLASAETFTGSSPATPDQVGPALRGMVTVLGELIDKRRARPGDDLVSELVQTHDADGARLTDTELLALAMLVIQAGHDSVRQFLAQSVCTLLAHPDQLELVLADPSRWRTALPEIMRHATPVKHAFRRFATEPVEVEGHTVQAGEGVLVVLAAANHDADQFAEAGRLDVTRTPNPHLGFSHGPHFCPGASLALTQAEIALSALFGRFPGLRLAVPAEQIAPRFLIGMQRLPVRLA